MRKLFVFLFTGLGLSAVSLGVLTLHTYRAEAKNMFKMAAAFSVSGEYMTIAMSSDPHIGVDASDGTTPVWKPMVEFCEAMLAMDADIGIINGDLSGNGTGSGGTQTFCGQVSDTRLHSPTNPVPCASVGNEWLAQMATCAAMGVPTNRILTLGGNTDDNPVDKNAPAAQAFLKLSDGFLATYAKPLLTVGLTAAPQNRDGLNTHQFVVTSPTTGAVHTWEILAVSDDNNDIDLALGGRCSSAATPQSCPVAGQPANATTGAQYARMLERIQAANTVNTDSDPNNNRSLIFAFHALPPNTTLDTFEGEGFEDVCTGSGSQLLHNQHVSIVAGDRPDLDQEAPWDRVADGGQGRTINEFNNDWAGTTVWAPYGPDEDWFEELILNNLDSNGNTPVKVVTGGHAHLWSPLAIYNGHGTSSVNAEGTLFINAGTLTYSKFAIPRAGEFRGYADGTYEIVPWALDKHRESEDPAFSCYGDMDGATLPATIPGPYGNVPVITGP